MSQFWLHFQNGFNHVLDFNGYFHLLFLVVLTVPYLFKDWKKILVLLSAYSIGLILSLLLASFGIVKMRSDLVAFMIPVTILIAAVYVIFTAGKSAKSDKAGAVVFVTLFFGIIHGLGSANYFNATINTKHGDKLIPLLEFALGVIAAEIIVAIVVLILAYVVQNFFRFSKRDWILVVSALAAGIVLPAIIGNEIWQ